MADDITLRLKLLDEFSATLKKYQAELKQTETQSTQSADKMSAGFSRISGMVKALAGTAAFAGFVQGLRYTVTAAAEAETAQAKLVAAMRATGNYSEDAARSVDQWANAYLQATGISDELAKSLVAEGLAMGKTVEQSKRLAEAAANMAPIVGSVEGAMGLLIRASNGSTEALKRYGIQVTEAEAKSGDFESVLQRVEKQFAGQAAAQLDTYAGKMALLKENFGNLAESIGNEVLPVANAWLGWINKAITDYQRLGTATEELDRKQLLLLRNQLAAKEIALQGGLISIGGGNLGDIQEKIKEVDAALVRLARKAEADRFFEDILPKAGVFAPTKPDDAKKKEAERLKAELERMAVTQGAILKNLDDENAKRFAAQKNGLSEIAAKEAVILGQYKAESDMVNKLISDYERLSYTADPEARARFEAQKGAPTQAQTMNAVISGKAQAQREMIDKTISDYTNKLKEVGTAEEEKMRAQKEYTDANSVATANAVEGAKAAKKRTMTDMEAAQAAYSFGQALIGVGMSLRSGNVGGAVAGIGNMAMMGSALMKGSPAAPWMFGVGAGLSLFGGLFGSKQPTPGQQARRELEAMFSDIGLPRMSRGGPMTREEMGGQYALWETWAEFLTGMKEANDREAGMLAGGFEDLNLTMGETVDALALMKSRADDISFMAAQQSAAWAGLISTADLTTEQFTDLVSAYREGYHWQQQYNDALKTFEKDLQGGADQNVLLADRQRVVDLLKRQEDAQRKTEQELRDAGVSQNEINKETKSVADNTAEMNTKLGTIVGLLGGTQTKHSGKFVQGYRSHLAWIRDDEDVVPPEKRMSYAANLLGNVTGGYQPSVTVNISGVVGDPRAVYREVHRGIQKAMARREV